MKDDSSSITYQKCICGENHNYGDNRDRWIRELHEIDQALDELSIEEEKLYEERRELEQAKYELTDAITAERD